MKIDAVDLFCGAGGLSYGLNIAGVVVKAGIDLDPACSYPYQENIIGSKFILKDITQIAPEDISGYYSEGSLKLLAGCAPCQPFSTLRNGQNAQESDKWPLLNEFGRLVKGVLPDFVTMENVPSLKNQSIFEDFKNLLVDIGYFVSFQIVDAAEYGLPQRRKRLVLLASKLGPIKLLSPEELGRNKKTVRDAIGELPTILAGQMCKNDPLHKSQALGELNMARMKASKPGGSWLDWPESLRSPCHQSSTGASFKSVYARMEWDKPSPTITTQFSNFGTGRFGHPEQNRAVSLREAAILQSFPKDYKFVEKGHDVHIKAIARLIGNAVPVDLGSAIGFSVLEHAKKYRN